MLIFIFFLIEAARWTQYTFPVFKELLTQNIRTNNPTDTPNTFPLNWDWFCSIIIVALSINS